MNSLFEDVLMPEQLEIPQSELPNIPLVQGNFVLHVNNYPFVHEKRRYAHFDNLGSESDAVLAAVGVIAVIGFALIFGRFFQPDPNQAALLTFVIVIVLLIPEIVVLWCFAQNYRLTRKGQMVEGRIVSSRGQYMAYTKKGYAINWGVFIEYCFTTPDKRQLTGRDSALRHDLREVVPKVGTPVKVLYMSDSWYKVL
jgi:hypothetical protein